MSLTSEFSCCQKLTRHSFSLKFASFSFSTRRGLFFMKRGCLMHGMRHSRERRSLILQPITAFLKSGSSSCCHLLLEKKKKRLRAFSSSRGKEEDTTLHNTSTNTPGSLFGWTTSIRSAKKRMEGLRQDPRLRSLSRREIFPYQATAIDG